VDEQKLLAAAEAELGNGDQLLAIGMVQPRGAGLAMLAGGSFGAGAGGLIGGSLGAASRAIGGVAGTLAGQQADAAGAGHDGETAYMFIAASAERLYVFQGHTGLTVTLGPLLATFERDDVSIELHSRPLRQILVIEVLHSGDRWAFEAPRGPAFHDRALLAVLHPG
jgi:hypothetical protein